MDKIIEHVGEKSRANAIENFMRLLYCEEVRLKLEEKKSKFNYHMRSVLDLVMKIESGRNHSPSYLHEQPKKTGLRKGHPRETYVFKEEP